MESNNLNALKDIIHKENIIENYDYVTGNNYSVIIRSKKRHNNMANSDWCGILVSVPQQTGLLDILTHQWKNLNTKKCLSVSTTTYVMYFIYIRHFGVGCGTIRMIY